MKPAVDKGMMRQMLLIAVLGAVVIAVMGSRRPHKFPRPITCCREVSNAVIQKIKSFTRQHAQHPCLDAIVFTTEDKKKYCTDPKAPWVEKTIKDLKPQ
ncbi:C-C motif chemokine 8-like isoform X1 [Alosa sapidissima]|uniref:C-C motif chemokine 8-like isoform X1 n=1 Tax=Alosa sapidissima TaxID=34773 RepID=UPI001C09331B|nr:C-C motif chemokine 8-like isoform X1 [Alosa sapidissima]